MMRMRFYAGISRSASNNSLRLQNLQRKFATAVAEDLPSEEEVIEQNNKSVDGLFPWRSMPPLKKQTLQELITGYTADSLIKNHFMPGNSVIAPE